MTAGCINKTLQAIKLVFTACKVEQRARRGVRLWGLKTAIIRSFIAMSH